MHNFKVFSLIFFNWYILVIINFTYGFNFSISTINSYLKSSVRQLKLSKTVWLFFPSTKSMA